MKRSTGGIASDACHCYCWNLLLILLWTVIAANTTLWGLTALIQYHYQHTARPLLNHYQWSNHTQRQNQATYYERHCTMRDVSTTHIEDLLVKRGTDEPPRDSINDDDNVTNTDKIAQTAVEKLTRHGAVVLPGVILPTLADEARRLTLERNANLKDEQLVFVMNSFLRHKQTRWAFAIDPIDERWKPFLRALARSHLGVTMEALLGPNPAIVKLQTITARDGAEAQPWHPDTSSTASVTTFARTFMPHFSVLVPLQDTTPQMGASEICPGTQYCATLDEPIAASQRQGRGENEDSLNTCLQVKTSKNENESSFWKAGDALIFNQNTWHRGGAHSKKSTRQSYFNENQHESQTRHRPTTSNASSTTPPKDNAYRAVVVLTFTSRPRMGRGRWQRYSRLLEQERNQEDDENNELGDRRRFWFYSSQWLWGVKEKESSNTKTACGMPTDSFRAQKSASPGYYGLQSHQPTSFAGEQLEGWLDQQVETRVLGHGTPLTSFGYTLNDLKHDTVFTTSATHRGHLSLLQNFESMLRFLGMWKASKAQWGWDYLTSLPSRVAAETHKFKDTDLARWLNHMKGHSSWRNRLVAQHIVYSSVPRRRASEEGRGIWDVWYGRTLDKLHESTKFGMIVVVGLVVMLWLLATVTQSFVTTHRFAGTAKPSTKRLFLALIAYVGLLGAIVLGLHVIIETLPITMDINFGAKLQHPFMQKVGPDPFLSLEQVNEGPLTAPCRHDILLGTRFDSPHLRFLNRFLDFHHGNVQWEDVIHTYSPISKAQCSPSSFDRSALGQAMISGIIHDSPGRYLWQEPATGNFTELGGGRRWIHTRRKLIVSCDPLMFQLRKRLATSIAFWRFDSILRQTSLAWMTVRHAQQLLRALFEEESINMPISGFESKRKRQRLLVVQNRKPPMRNTKLLVRQRNPLDGLFYLSRYITEPCVEEKRKGLLIVGRKNARRVDPTKLGSARSRFSIRRKMKHD